MSITIVPQAELERQSTNSIIRKIPLLFYPAPVGLYARRFERLQQLSQTNPFSDYLQFCASLVQQQALLLKSNPIEEKRINIEAFTKTPLSIEHNPLSHDWQHYLPLLFSGLASTTHQITDVVSNLQKNSASQLQEKANALLNKNFDAVESNEALFIWSALSLYYTQLASQIKGNAISDSTDKQWLCPVCNSLPVASIIQIGANVGLRYLHCSLCESEWYVPRIKCTNCDDLQHVHYLSLDEEKAACQTECCDNCHSYLKIFNQDMEPHLDIVADDLASLILDIKTEEDGFFKSGLNPFLFAQELS